MNNIELVTCNPYALIIVKNQTDEICIAAVQQNGRTLVYVKNQTDEICIAAVQQDAFALLYVKNQTSEICMAAVQQDGSTLQYVRQQTPEICMAAVQQYGWACTYIKSQLFDYDEYVYMMYVAIYKSRIFCNIIGIDTIENKINYLKRCCKHITDKLINDIMIVHCRSTKRANLKH
jgi:hypothetical protein